MGIHFALAFACQKVSKHHKMVLKHRDFTHNLILEICMQKMCLIFEPVRLRSTFRSARRILRTEAIPLFEYFFTCPCLRFQGSSTLRFITTHVVNCEHSAMPG